jgi:hypothetical protein
VCSHFTPPVCARASAAPRTNESPPPIRARSLLARCSYLFELLFESGDVIDAEKVREVAYYGIPGRTGLRSIVWKLLLG